MLLFLKIIGIGSLVLFLVALTCTCIEKFVDFMLGD